MSEKRFRITTNPMSQSVAFDEKEKKYYIGIELEDLLNEQQATIRKLQDLCGESDGENAKLRIENEKLRQSVEYWQKKYEEGTETFISKNDEV